MGSCLPPISHPSKVVEPSIKKIDNSQESPTRETSYQVTEWQEKLRDNNCKITHGASDERERNKPTLSHILNLESSRSKIGIRDQNVSRDAIVTFRLSQICNASMSNGGDKKEGFHTGEGHQATAPCYLLLQDGICSRVPRLIRGRELHPEALTQLNHLSCVTSC